MRSRRPLLLVSLLLAYAPAAWPKGEESDDDLLAPLTPAEVKVKRKRKKPLPPLVDKKPPVREAPAPVRLLVRLEDAGLRNARLFLDDREIGVLPLEALDAAPGEHRVAVKRLGYAPFNATVRLKESGTTELMAVLEPLAGVLSVSSEVVGAEVFMDGKSYGPVPVNDLVIAPGDHQLRVKRDGYEERTQALGVKAGRDYNLLVNLTPLPLAVAKTDRPERSARLEPRSPGPGPTSSAGNALSTRAEREQDRAGVTPWFGQWYVWAGGAAVAAGAAAGGFYMLQPRNPCGTRACDACINAPPSMKQFCPALVRLPFLGIGLPVGGP